MREQQSKSTQVKHERMLNDLFKLPGNDRCADCTAKNPRWASYSLGVFLCIRCASLHRKMGTHISKVKSVSMDRWTLQEIQVSFFIFLKKKKKIVSLPQTAKLRKNIFIAHDKIRR
ncbi:hypothetical protein BD770DRAFT_321223 [Pilaira anomala]|nr:hypothetical protein BD770DRAFT_321223 [Pilaira anomala]